MDDFKVHFKRTLKIIDLLKLDFHAFPAGAIYSKQIIVDLKFLEFIDSQTQLPIKTLELLKEIYAIEKEKMSLGNGQAEIIEIFKQEVEIYRFRENLLNNPIDKFLDLTFVINPYVKTYESNWNWSQVKLDEMPDLYDSILNSEKDDYHFILQQTGTYDELIESNILESPLSEYQAYMLCLFEKPAAIISALEIFENEFDTNSEEEKNQLREITDTLIQELIFRNFIIKLDT
jgi:hypothetical protein